ncbi:hypothetical protein SY91_04120 [Burkholderia cenocepacia]|nr:hypothetical protein SY91_04120 [Burkholderia cenocepacia]
MAHAPARSACVAKAISYRICHGDMMTHDLDLDKMIAGVKKTGYPLEYEISAILKSRGWTIISGMYYIDSDRDQPREIDIVAYKISNTPVKVVTALIISCKKSANAAWGFLARSADHSNPNIVYDPFHFWTDNKPMQYYIEKENWRNIYPRFAASRRVNGILDKPEFEVFALQPMEMGAQREDGAKGKDQGKPSDSPAMFESVMSLMKAQQHYLNRGSKGRKVPRFYQYNLISLADTKFIRFDFSDSGIGAEFAERIPYIGRYIFKDDDVFSKIWFVTKNDFPSLLSEYDRLHEANVKLVKGKTEEFYKNIMKDSERIDVLLPEFQKKLVAAIGTRIKTERPIAPDDFYLFFVADDVLEICYVSFEDISKKLNSNKHILARTAEILKSLFKYEGPFKFTDL